MPMLETSKINFDIDIGTCSIFDLIVQEDEFPHKLRDQILDNFPQTSNSNFFDEQTKLVFELNSLLSSENGTNGNISVSQPLGIITDNNYNEAFKNESKSDLIMKKLERIFLMPNIFDKPPSDSKLAQTKIEEIEITEPPKIKITDKFIIPEFTFDDSNNTKALFEALSFMNENDDDKDAAQQLSIILKTFIQKIQELKNQSNSVVTEWRKEAPTPYSKILCYIHGFFSCFSKLPCFLQVASFTIFKHLPIFTQKTLSPRRMLIIAPASSRALKEAIMDMDPIFYVPSESIENNEQLLDNFKSGAVVYFFDNSSLDIKELLKYKWDCTMIFAEAKETKPMDKAHELLSKLQTNKLEKLGFTIWVFETSENLWSNIILHGSLLYKWFFPSLYQFGDSKSIDATEIITQYLSSLIPMDEKQRHSEWLLKVLDLLVFKLDNDQIFPFYYLYNDKATDLLQEKLTRLMKRIKKQCKYTKLDNINVIFMNEDEFNKAKTFLTQNEIECCDGENVAGKLRLLNISEVYNIEVYNVFVFAHFTEDLAKKIIAVMKKPSKYDKTIWFLQAKSEPIEMENFCRTFEVFREAFLDEEGRESIYDDKSMAKELKNESIREKPLIKKFQEMSETFNKELIIEPDGSEKYKNKFRKTLGIYQKARRQVEAEIRHQQLQQQLRESESYTPEGGGDTEPSTPTSKSSRAPKRKPPPLKTTNNQQQQQQQQNISRQTLPNKKPIIEPPKATWTSINETIKIYVPQLFGVSNRIPFAPLHRSVIKKAINEKSNPLNPIDEYNLTMAAVKFQIFGSYYRNMERDGECYRVTSHPFNWDSVCFYLNYCLNCTPNYLNKWDINKKFFRRFFRRTLISRAIHTGTNYIVNRRLYDREFYDYLSYDEEKSAVQTQDSQLQYDFKIYFNSQRFETDSKNQEIIDSTSKLELLGKKFASESKEISWMDLFIRNNNNSSSISSDQQQILPAESFADYFSTDFDSLLYNEVCKNVTNYSAPNEIYQHQQKLDQEDMEIDNSETDTNMFDLNNAFSSEFLSQIEKFDIEWKSNLRLSLSSPQDISYSDRIIMDYGDFVPDEPISPTEPSDADNIKEDMSFGKSLNEMDTIDDENIHIIGIGPTRKRIKGLNDYSVFNSSNKFMSTRIPSSIKFNETSLTALFGSIMKDGEDSENGSACSSSDEEDGEDEADEGANPKVEKDLAADVVNLDNANQEGDQNNKKRKAPNDEDDDNENENAAKRRRIDDGEVTPPTTTAPTFHLSPSDDRDDQADMQEMGLLRIQPQEKEINFASIHLLDKNIENYFENCRPYLNALNNYSKLAIMDSVASAHENNGMNLLEINRNFYYQLSLRKSISNSVKSEAQINDDLEENMINLSGAFTRQSLAKHEIEKAEVKNFSLSFNDLLIRQYYERALSSNSSSSTSQQQQHQQRYAYGDTSVMPANPSKIQALRRGAAAAAAHQQQTTASPLTSSQSPQKVLITAGNVSGMQGTPVPRHLVTTATSYRPITPTRDGNIHGEQQPQFQRAVISGGGFTQRPQMQHPHHHQQQAMPQHMISSTMDGSSGGSKPAPQPGTNPQMSMVRQVQQQQQSPSVGSSNNSPAASATGAIQQQQNQSTTTTTAAAAAALRPLNFPYEYHSNLLNDKCECSNKDLGQPLYYNDDIPNYDEINPIIRLQKAADNLNSDSPMKLLYNVCKNIPFNNNESTKVKEEINEEVNKLLSDISTNEFTPPLIPSLSVIRENCQKNSRERFKNRQQIYVTVRGFSKSDIMVFLKQYEMKFNIPFSDIFNLKVRRLPAYDVRYHLISWRTMALSNKLRKIMESKLDGAEMGSKQRFLESMAPRKPLTRSASMEHLEYKASKKIVFGRSKSLPNLTNLKELTPSQIYHLKFGFKDASLKLTQLNSSKNSTKTNQKKQNSFSNQQEAAIEEEAPQLPKPKQQQQPSMKKWRKQTHRKIHHLGVSKMSLIINKKKITTVSRFYNPRKPLNPREILPLYQRWRKPYHVEEYWKYTKDRRQLPPTMFDVNLKEFFL